MSLYQDLLYNWERAVYSVIKDEEGRFIIVSTKAPIRRFWFTGSCDTLEQAKKQLGLSYSLTDEQLNDKKWEIVDTLHPSSLMGKGYQVGDKVIIKHSGLSGEVVEVEEDPCSPIYTVEFDDTSGCFSQQDLKPVLPVEEEEKKEYHFSVNINGLKIMADDLLPPNTFIVDNGKEQLRFKFEDGKIVNL